MNQELYTGEVLAFDDRNNSMIGYLVDRGTQIICNSDYEEMKNVTKYFKMLTLTNFKSSQRFEEEIIRI
jgi:hypothetical protein